MALVDKNNLALDRLADAFEQYAEHAAGHAKTIRSRRFGFDRATPQR